MKEKKTKTKQKITGFDASASATAVYLAALPANLVAEWSLARVAAQKSWTLNISDLS